MFSFKAQVSPGLRWREGSWGISAGKVKAICFRIMGDEGVEGKERNGGAQRKRRYGEREMVETESLTSRQ